MTLHWPWMLLTLPVVAAVAIWALLRPDRPRVLVGSLSLWREALASLDAAGRRRARRVSLAWLCVLAGSVLAAAALARPAQHAARAMRHVSLIVSPSAELAGDGGAKLRGAVSAFLGRLGPDDRVQIVLPAALGGAGEWLTAARAREQISDVKPLPARWDELTAPQSSADAQLRVAFVPAGAMTDKISADAIVEVPVSLPPVTIDRLAAAGSDGQLQVFTSLRNHTPSPQTVSLDLAVFVGGLLATGGLWDVTVPPQATLDVVRTAGPGEWVAVMVAQGDWPGDLVRAYLVHRPVVRRAVAMVGRDDPMVRRFIRFDPLLHLVSDVERADLVIAIGAEAPVGKPVMRLGPPAGSSEGTTEYRENVSLARASAAVDDDVMAGVDLSDVAIRRLPLRPSAVGRAGKRLVTVDGQAVIARSKPTLLSGPSDRVINVAFDISPANTNWTLTESFVIFMTNAVRWLAPAGESDDHYGYLTSLEAGPRSNEAYRIAPSELLIDWADGFLSPGTFQVTEGESKRLMAVSLVGLRGGRPARPVAEQIAAVRLPAPAYADVGRECWPMAVIAAGLFWLAGWRLSVRSR